MMVGMENNELVIKLAVNAITLAAVYFIGRNLVRRMPAPNVTVAVNGGHFQTMPGTPSISIEK